MVSLSAALLAGASWVWAQEPPPVVPSLSAIADDDANLALKKNLDERYRGLWQRFQSWQSEATAYNSRYGGRSLDADSPEAQAGAAEQARLAGVLKDYEHDTELYKAELATLRLEPEAARIIKGMNALARRLGWSTEKRARLDRALKELDSLGEGRAAGEVIRTWQAIKSRGADGELARASARGSGALLSGAGEQRSYTDCAVFALANATALPYSVVAARAAELISQGDWHSAAERAHPQALIERHGLNGGEVIMLAESFGQAEVVSRSDFARTLKGGRPLLIDVVPAGGRGEHEVVLTRTFQHAGATWYELMDSYQGPQRRLYLSGQELNTILLANGVAFRPEPGTVPELLGTGGAR